MLVAERAERVLSLPNSEQPCAPETCPRKRRSLSGRLVAERAESVPSLMQPDTTPSRCRS
jgi:hypothetical protein